MSVVGEAVEEVIVSSPCKALPGALLTPIKKCKSLTAQTSIRVSLDSREIRMRLAIAAISRAHGVNILSRIWDEAGVARIKPQETREVNVVTSKILLCLLP